MELMTSKLNPCKYNLYMYFEMTMAAYPTPSLPANATFNKSYLFETD